MLLQELSKGKLAEKGGIMFCHACGADNDDGNRFCRSCGTELQSADPAASATAGAPLDQVAETAPSPAAEDDAGGKVCPACGTSFDAGMKFCDRDGAALVAAAAVVAPSPDPEEPAPPPAEQAQAPADTAAEPEEAAPAVAESAQVQSFCESCGSRLEPGDTFCASCGSRTEPPGESDRAEPSPEATDAAPDEMFQPQEAEPEPEPEPERAAYPEPSVTAPQVPEPAAIAAAGSPLTAPASAQPATDRKPETAAELPILAEPGVETEVEETPARKSRAWIWAIGAFAVLGAGGGAGYVYRDQVMAYAVKAGIPISTGSADAGALGDLAGEDTEAPAIPRVAGKYTAFLMDQEIEIEFEGEPEVLAQSRGTARYLNTVNGGRCVSRLVAIESGGIGGSTDSKVLFSQQPKDGEPPCGQDIPMQIDIDKQAMNADGRVSRLAVEWQSPETREVLMSGDLVIAEAAD
jgi:predicted amidophosphoribosyltransferase